MGKKKSRYRWTRPQTEQSTNAREADKERAEANRWANPEMHAAMVGLCSSSAASPHVPSPKKGTRTTKKRAAIREVSAHERESGTP